VGAGLARERVAGATRQDTRGLSNGGTNSVSGILPGASLPFAGRARSHKVRSHKPKKTEPGGSAMMEKCLVRSGLSR